MPCYHPLKAYVGREEKVTFSYRDAFRTPSGKTFPVDLPCGQCIGCRLERSRKWAVRCMHEASLYENNCFITLTFSEERLNKQRSLCKSDFQKFMKRLRKRFEGCQEVWNDKSKKFERPIRFFHCGEYGDSLGRPHHHACLFNFDFPDKEIWSIKGGNNIYISPVLSELWPFGHHTIGDVTFESAAYVSRYIVKKIHGEKAEAHYKGREPEYVTMSRRPGIGKRWINEYSSDVYPHDFVVVRGSYKCKPPRYYDDHYNLQNPKEYDKLKKRREVTARNNPDNSVKRLAEREKYTKCNLKRKERSYETEGV
jgi:hypothetical protein